MVPTATLVDVLRDLLGRGHACWWRPRGSSMWPAIRDGERILIAPVSAAELRIGDIVQYVVPEGTRVHRLLERRRASDGRWTFVLVGDNDDASPDAVTAAEVVGRAVAVEREGRVIRLDALGARARGWLKIARRRRREARRAPRTVTPSAAHRAVLTACRTVLDTSPPAAFRDALAQVSPDAALVALRRERLGPIAHVALGGAPAALASAVAADYYAAARRYVRFAERLAEALAALRAADVPVVVLKGMALAEPLYGNPALRPMEDIDLLVGRHDVERTRIALGSIGYPPPASFAEDRRRRAASMFTRAEADGGPPARIDVHWSLVDAKSSPVAGRWADGVRERVHHAEIGNGVMTVLAPIDALLHACVHLTVNHGLLGLLWRLDIALMVRCWADAFDWDRVVATAAESRLNGIVYAALRCSQATLGGEIPGRVLERLRPRSARARGLERWLLPRFAALGSIPYQDYVVPLLTMDRARDVAAVLFRRLGA